MSVRNAKAFRAMAAQDERSRPTGQVDLWGVLYELKAKPIVRGLMTPAQARSLAVELLQAADRAEAATR